MGRKTKIRYLHLSIRETFVERSCHDYTPQIMRREFTEAAIIAPPRHKIPDPAGRGWAIILKRPAVDERLENKSIR
jgi:hypothetical protein